MRYLVFLLMVCRASFIMGQEVVFEAPMTALFVQLENWESHTHVDTTFGTTTQFVFSVNEVDVLFLDNKYSLLRQMKVSRTLARQYKFLGNVYAPTALTHRLLFTNLTKRKYCVTTINLETGKDTTVAVDIDVNNDAVIAAGTFQQKFYLLTIKPESSILSLYILDEQNRVSVTKHDFSQHKFSGESPFTLSSVLSGAAVCTFDPNNPVDFINSGSKFNHYISNNILYLSLDNSSHVTKIISIDLLKGTSVIKVFRHEKTEGEATVSSYMFKDYLYHLKIIKHSLYFSVYDIKKDSLVFRRGANEELNRLTNSKFMEFGGLTETNQGLYQDISMKAFLRKINRLRIVVEDVDQNLKVRIGDYTERTCTTPHTYTGANGYLESAYTPNGRKCIYSVYAFILLDPTTHQRLTTLAQGSLLDKINSYAAEKKFFVENITRGNNYTLYSYYDKTRSKYCLVKFQD